MRRKHLRAHKTLGASDILEQRMPQYSSTTETCSRFTNIRGTRTPSGNKHMKCFQLAGILPSDFELVRLQIAAYLGQARYLSTPASRDKVESAQACH